MPALQLHFTSPNLHKEISLYAKQQSSVLAAKKGTPPTICLTAAAELKAEPIKDKIG